VNLLFADSYYFLAILNKSDPGHFKAVVISRQPGRPIVTSAWILTELADALSASHKRSNFVTLLDRLRTSPAWTIVPPDEDSFERGVRLYAGRADKDWSLTDCISFTLMDKFGVTEALTADVHFEQAGFRALLR
jgi:uncharacterized protein